MSEHTINVMTLVLVAGFYLGDTLLTLALFNVSRMAYPRTAVGDAMVRKYAGLSLTSFILFGLYLLSAAEQWGGDEFTTLSVRMVIRVLLLTAMLFTGTWKAILVHRLYHLHKQGGEIVEVPGDE